MKKLERLTVLFIACLVTAGLVDLPASGQEKQPSSPPQSASTQQSPAARLGIFPYPKNNQSAEQQKKDENECYDWAKQQTGVDPEAAAPPSQEAKKAKGGAAKGAAGGAAGGAAIGAIAGDAGTGAAIGATAGAMRGRRQQKKANKQAKKEAEATTGQQKQQTLDVFKKAFGSCMEGRGYSVK